jgi:predicted membrane metal-binding protein
MSAHENARSFDDRPPPSLKSFGLTFAAVFAIVGLWPLVWRHADPRWWALAVAALFAAVTFLAPQILKPLNQLWHRFGLLLHGIISPIILGLMFFVAVTPIALVLRLFGKRLIPTGFDSAATSYWVERTPPGPDPQSLKNQF